MLSTMKGFLTWADRLFNPWLSDAAAVGSQAAALSASAVFGDPLEAAEWQSQARAFARFTGRRQRVFAGPWCRVLDDRGREAERIDFWSLVRATPDLDWLLLVSDAETAIEALPRDWGGGYKNVWIGAKGTGADRVERATREVRKVPSQMRFLVTTPVACDPGDLDLAGIGWVLVNGAIRAEVADWATSVKLQAMCYGVPVWFESPQRVDLAGDGGLIFSVREQPRFRA